MKYTKAATWILCAIALCIPAGIRAQAQTKDKDAKTAPKSTAKVYKLVGTVKSVDTRGRSLTVDHKDIPGFMAAMTMPYAAGKNVDLSKISANDAITADVVVDNGDIHLDNVKVTGKGK